jgi:hypothetical protein
VQSPERSVGYYVAFDAVFAPGFRKERLITPAGGYTQHLRNDEETKRMNPKYALNSASQLWNLSDGLSRILEGLPFT